MKNKNKTLVNKQYNENQKLRRAKYFFIVSPPQFLNPFKSFIINPLFIISEKENSLFASLRSALALKKVETVQVNYPEEGEITFNFSQNHILQEFPINYVIARLKSFSDPDYNQWATLIENYQNNYQKSFQNTKN